MGNDREQELTPEQRKEVVQKITQLSERELKEEVKRRSEPEEKR